MSSTTTTSTVVADNRATDRGNGVSQPVAAGGAAGGVAAKPRKRGRGGVTAVGRISITADEITAAVGAAEAAALKATDALKALLPMGLTVSGRVHKAKVGAGVFINGMAALQTKFGAGLGPLSTDPKNMEDLTAAAAAAGEAGTAIAALGLALSNVGNLCLQGGMEEARIVYNQARALSVANGALAAALEPFTVPNARPAKKGAATRRAKAKAGRQQPAAPVAPVAAPATTTSTTVTSG